MESPRYWAFISYSHRDTRWADWLHKSLEAYRPPKNLIGTTTPRGTVPKRMSPVFRDREELASATDLGTVINEALAGAACQVVICSPQAAKSKWVNEEILAFKRLGREDRIFCLIIGGEPNATDMPGREDEECFPPALRFRLGADGALSGTRTEPIAADARPGKDGKQNAKLKLIAGILGVGFDALRRREQQRRNRRLVVFASAAMVGMVITSGLATYAFIEQKAAERQRARAEAEAETARQTTNFLVDLFRISDPSEARGNAVTAREMLDKGALRIDRELARQPGVRATLMDTLGTVYTGLGLFPQARPLLDGAVTIRRASAAQDPLPLSVSLAHVGDVMSWQSDYDGAEKAYREAIAIQSARRSDARSAAELQQSLRGLGLLLEKKGRYGDAAASLRESLELQRSLYGPTSGEVARTLQELARVAEEDGDLNGAIPMMRTALEMQRARWGATPHPDLADAIVDLALLLEERGDYDEAERLHLEAIAMDRRLLGDKHVMIAKELNNLAMVLHDKGELQHAEARYREAIAMQRDLLGETNPYVAAMLNNLAFIQHDRGDVRGAIATERNAIEILRRLFPGDHPEVARYLNRVGFWMIEVGDLPAAQRDLETSLAMRRRLLGANHPDVGGSLIHVAFLQVAQHLYPEARASAQDAVAILSPALSSTHWKTALARSAEGAALAGLGRYAEAEPLLVDSLAILSKDGGAPPEYARLAQRYLDALRSRTGHAARAAVATASAAGGLH